MNHHAWLQKHPTPLAVRGEFHWYPDAADASDRELRAAFVERVRGVEPPAVLWHVEPGRVAWGQVFSATAPLDGRRYVGLVLSVVTGDRPAAELIGMLAPPPAEPWGVLLPTESFDREHGLEELIVFPRTAHGDVAAVARALMAGGAARVDDPTSIELPRWIASIARLVPSPAGPCRGLWCTGDAGGPSVAAGSGRGGVGEPGARGARDRVAELVAAAWREPGSSAAKAWTLLCELASARGEPVDCTGAALEAVDIGAALTAAERAELAGCESVVAVLHAWGRGRLDRSPTADTLPSRLADLVALGVLSRLACGQDAQAAIAEARWYALLPARRRAALLGAVAQRTASLRGIVEAHHV